MCCLVQFLAHALFKELAAGVSSVCEVVLHVSYMQRISAYDRLTNAVRQIVPDVMNTAAAMDVELEMYMANGTTLPLLFCVPILVKDNMDVVDGESQEAQCMRSSSASAAYYANYTNSGQSRQSNLSKSAVHI